MGRSNYELMIQSGICAQGERRVSGHGYIRMGTYWLFFVDLYLVSGVNYSFSSTTTRFPDSCWNFVLSSLMSLLLAGPERSPEGAKRRARRQQRGGRVSAPVSWYRSFQAPDPASSWLPPFDSWGCSTPG